MKPPHVIFLALAFALTAPHAAPADTQWRILPNSPNFGLGTRHEDLWFTSPTQGWMVNGFGRIMHTSDGGENWQVQINQFRFLRSVTFATPARGWSGILFDETDGLFETFDSGAHWTIVPNLPPEFPRGTCGMWAASQDVVYGVGRYYMPASLIKTTDAGTTWRYTDMGPWATSLVDCYFPTPDLGFTVGGAGAFPDSSRAVVLRTTDGGATWSTRHTSSRIGEWGWKITFPSPSVGYVSVERNTPPQSILKTTDGGDTWVELPAPDEHQQGIGFITDNVGWLGGPGNPTYTTTDGGATWTAIDFMQNVNRIRVLHEGLAYAVGRRIYRYSPLDPTGVEGVPLAVVAALQPSAPNPFRESTSIPFAVERPGRGRLEVFDVTGRLVARLHDGPLAAGTHRVTWDGRDEGGRSVPAGVYFYRLETGGRSEARKVQVLR
ncbi:T9SS type A sorting domain-containing protein [bacterium]|nr:T9SS type A sorting domain-containing protein [bacterium]